jgi:uncharacterized protein YxeA
MKKIIVLLVIFIIVLIFTIVFLLYTKNLDNSKLAQQSTISTSLQKQKTLLDKPISSIDIEPFLIDKFCKAATGNATSTWKHDKFPRMPVEGKNSNNYICLIDDKPANKNLFDKSPDLQNLGYTPVSICSNIFNQEFFRGVATDDQYACTLMLK